ncbi:regulatory protein RecX [Mucilaginibacter myungsuensis]|uniref:Regulatory protein RecX n=1 Tax=Mucilaginibacter myungsuensis TaxID=649104 RepID=A0A929KVP6_9SPHI|nr:RecX family transcriptional regulator [Mucilaginibacter myungsuensis]MBE9660758.1 RecX family transcriptional regulator [Mucilaginibacter myungsuensis]MDN3600803.1 RecX family transcriptional regulator [Mucilaginibacter myungsuensis]
MEAPKPKKINDPNVALAKAEHYCGYQERSQQEVRDKLYEWGLWPEAVENTITKLIDGNFINEQRFAFAYARGKFNQKGWGKIKIKQGLKFKRVSDALIKKALGQIDLSDYITTLKTVLDKKAALLKEKDERKRHYKLKQYAMGRGFESETISEVLKDNDL